MKYALLIYSPTTAEEYAALTTALRQPGTPPGAWTDDTQAAKDADVLLAAEQLTHSETATSVRFRGEERLITDGPFMETKEMLGGLSVIEAPDLNAAVQLAAGIPFAQLGSVEVRPVPDYTKSRPKL